MENIFDSKTTQRYIDRINKMCANTQRNLPTSPIFIISDERNFEVEQKKIIVNIQRVQQLGKTAFEGKNHTSFGPLSASEWNNLMVKHLDHHLAQFGV